MASFNGDITQLLKAFMSKDNTFRKQAETCYNNALASNPSSVVGSLATVLRSCPDVGVRSMAAVLLRQQFDLTHSSASAKLPAATLSAVKEQLLAVFAQEPNMSIARKVALTIAQLAATEFAAWPALMPAVLAQTKHTSTSRRELGYVLVGKLCEYAFKSLRPFGKELMAVFTTGLGDASLAVRVSVVKAFASFGIFLSSKAEYAAFGGLVPQVMAALQSTLAAGEELEAEEILKELVELARNSYGIFRAHLDSVAAAMLTAVGNSEVAEDISRLCVELLLTVCENGGAEVRKHSGLVKAVVPMALRLLASDEAPAGWAEGAYDPDAENTESGGGDEDSLAALGTEAMYRLANALHSVAMLPVAFEHIPAALGSDSAATRRAGALAIGLLGEGCHRGMREKLDTVLTMVIPATADKDMRVRHAALSSLALFAVDFGEKSFFQSKYHKKVVPVLAASLKASSGSCLRVRCHAAIALVNFCKPDNCPRSAIARYLGDVLPGLMELLASGLLWAQASALTALSCVALAADDAFGEYYNTFMPGLKALVAAPAPTDAHKGVRGRAMECVATIGDAVGKDMIAADAAAMLELIMREQAAGLPVEDPQTPYMLRTCSRLAKVLGDDFAKYLPLVLPPLLASAAKEVEMSVESADSLSSTDDGTGDDNVSRVTYDIRGVGLVRFCLNTSSMEEKLTAVKSLYQYASDLEEVFLPYVQQVNAVMVPLCSFKFSADIRMSACMVLPRLLYATYHGLKNTGKPVDLAYSYLASIVPVLAQQLVAEPNPDSRAGIAEAIKDVAALCHESRDSETSPAQFKLSLAQCDVLLTAICKATARSIDARSAVIEKFREQGLDEASEEMMGELLEVELDLMTFLVDSIGYQLKTHGPAFLPLFTKHLVPTFGKLLAPATSSPLRLNALCCYVDAIEFCGEGGKAFVMHVLPTLAACISSDYEDLRQCSLYGIGVVARIAPEAIMRNAATFASKIAQIITAPDSKSDANIYATENAVSALGRLCKYLPQAAGLNLAAMLKLWVSNLPLTEDPMEARANNEMLCEYMEAGNAAVLGAGGAHLPYIVNSVATILVGADGGDDDEELATEAVTARMLAALKNLGRTQPRAAMASAFASLTAAQQAALSAALA